MKPHGFSVSDANQKLQDAANKEFASLEGSADSVLEKPLESTTPMSHEEL